MANTYIRAQTGSVGLFAWEIPLKWLATVIKWDTNDRVVA